MYTVGEVAELAGVTVRALHHYDERGLLCPTGRSHAGYRLYDLVDLERLQELILYRALGFRLDEIAQLLDDPAHDREASLRRQRHLLIERAAGVSAMVKAVEVALAALDEGRTVSEKELFDGFEPGQYAEEAEERWGDTDAWKQSRRRTSTYGPDEWKAIKDEANVVEAHIGALFGAGVEPDADQAMAAVEAHRQHIERWFYDCPHAMHVGLGEMYIADPRFTAHYDDPHGAGCAAWVRAAIVANAAAHS